MTETPAAREPDQILAYQAGIHCALCGKPLTNPKPARPQLCGDCHGPGAGRDRPPSWLETLRALEEARTR